MLADQPESGDGALRLLATAIRQADTRIIRLPCPVFAAIYARKRVMIRRSETQ